uniref:Ataxin-10 domain-containing protein n=1 Tax=Ditylum brightwellii TaxID=49249 RepID=A0A7S2ET69_9STRA
MLRHMLPPQVIQSSIGNLEDNGDNKEKDHADTATEWISLVIERLSGLGLLPQMYRAAGGGSIRSNENDDDRQLMVTPEQVVLLNCVGQSVEEKVHPSMSSSSSSSQNTLLGGSLGEEENILTTFRFLVKEVEYIRSKFSTSSTTTVPDEHYDGENKCSQNAYMTILEIIATSLSYADQNNDSRRKSTNNTSSEDDTCLVSKLQTCLGQETSLLTLTLLDLGTLIDNLSSKNRGRKARELVMANEEQHLVVVLVRLIGNLCFRCRFNQDLVRLTEIPMSLNHQNDVNDVVTSTTKTTIPTEETTPKRNGLHVILSCTSFAYGCFTLREWALVAIRNILEDNDENQDIVSRLEAQQALDTPELQKMGIKVDLDKRGKVNIVHDEIKKEGGDV